MKSDDFGSGGVGGKTREGTENVLGANVFHIWCERLTWVTCIQLIYLHIVIFLLLQCFYKFFHILFWQCW